MSEENSFFGVQAGRVAEADTNACQIACAGALGSLPLALPYGIYAKPVSGSRCVVLSLPYGEHVNGGCLVEQDGLEPGEIRLQSAGGSYLVLKNDGTVHVGGTIVNEDL